MKRLGFALLLVSSVAFGKGSYLDNGKTVTHDCTKDPVVNVMGNQNVITITGACTEVVVAGNKNTLTVASTKSLGVAGNENTVTAEAADKIAITGSKNAVTYKKGVSSDTASLRNSGNDNTVTRAK